MQIGIDASRANKNQRSGVEWYSYHLIKQLYELDRDNSYFLYTPQSLFDDLKPLPENFQEKVLNWPLGKFWTQIRLGLEMMVNKPDLLFIPAHIFPPILSKKNIISWPDTGHKRFPECYSKLQLNIIERGLSRAVKVTDKLITISEFSKSEFVKYYPITSSKIKVIYLGYNEKVFYPRHESEIAGLKNKYQIKGKYLIYIGRLAKRKNLENLIEAYDKLSQNQNLDLILAGSCDFGYQAILDKIKQLNGRRRIKVLGYVPEEDLPALLSGAECLVHPSLFEGFGLTVLEAMACNCPVICSNSGSLPEIGQEAVEYFDPKKPEEISQKIVYLLSNSQLRSQLIERGQERVKQFSWKKCAEETLEIFNNLV